MYKTKFSQICCIWSLTPNMWDPKACSMKPNELAWPLKSIDTNDNQNEAKGHQ